MKHDTPNINSTLSYIPQGALFSYPDITHLEENHAAMQKNRNERLKLAISSMQIGQRIQKELKLQGRTVSWLARQLCMERTSLYYVFRQNSIDMELLLRISCHLNHNFLQEVNDVYKAYGL